MASLNIKNTALILAGMIAGGVISVGILYLLFISKRNG